MAKRTRATMVCPQGAASPLGEAVACLCSGRDLAAQAPGLCPGPHGSGSGGAVAGKVEFQFSSLTVGLPIDFFTPLLLKAGATG